MHKLMSFFTTNTSQYPNAVAHGSDNIIGINLIQELELAERIQNAVYLPAFRAAIRCGGTSKESADAIQHLRHLYPLETIEKAALDHAYMYMDLQNMKQIMDFAVTQFDRIHSVCLTCLESLKQGMVGQTAFLDAGAENRLKYTTDAAEALQQNANRIRVLNQFIRMNKLSSHVDNFIGSCIPANHKDTRLSAPSYAEQLLKFKQIQLQFTKASDITIEKFEIYVPDSLKKPGANEVIIDDNSFKMVVAIEELRKVQPKVDPSESDYKGSSNTHTEPVMVSSDDPLFDETDLPSLSVKPAEASAINQDFSIPPNSLLESVNLLHTSSDQSAEVPESTSVTAPAAVAANDTTETSVTSPKKKATENLTKSQEAAS